MIHSRKCFQGVLQNISSYDLLENESSESLKVSKKIRPLADVGTPSLRHGLNKRTSYGTSGNSVTILQSSSENICPKVVGNFLKMFLFDPVT
jgi:hypothetical protein